MSEVIDVDDGKNGDTCGECKEVMISEIDAADEGDVSHEDISTLVTMTILSGDVRRVSPMSGASVARKRCIGLIDCLLRRYERWLKSCSCVRHVVKSTI